jgi:hypothetical protein
MPGMREKMVGTDFELEIQDRRHLRRRKRGGRRREEEREKERAGETDEEGV